MGGKVVVTGATGNVGREVLRALAERHVPCVAAVRVPLRAKAILGSSLPLVELDLFRPETFAPALEGATGLFLMRPPAISRVGETLNPLVDAAVDAGVKDIVFLSVKGADSSRFVPHHAVEQHLTASAVGWTFLRAGFFAQNLGDAYRQDLVEDDRLYVPAGRGRVAWVDVRDLAELASMAFEDRRHRRKAYVLTGSEAVTFGEVAEILSSELGRSIRYDAASLPGYALHLGRRGLHPMHVVVQTALHAGLRLGHAEAVDSSLEELLGRRPRSIGDYVRDHAELWRPSP